MKILNPFLLILFTPLLLTAKPYFSQYIEKQPDKHFIVIFHGKNISEEDEPKIKVLERKYLEYENGDYLEYKHFRSRISGELNALGVSVEIIENHDKRLSEGPNTLTPKRRREVTCVIKDPDGDILAIGGDWGVIQRGEAIKEINNGTYEYYVKDGPNEVQVHVVLNKYLRTNPDRTKKNNLDDLPNCKGSY